jgi:8-oxo-dGTP pyrophosphatase MutT (NUDIX family)
MKKMRKVVTCFLRHDGRILVLRRSAKVRTYPGKWAGVSGGIEAATPLAQAYQEVAEEAGLGQDEVELAGQGAPLDVEDLEAGVSWRVHPFLFDVRDPSRVRLDWEHAESRWVHPEEIGTLDTVPKLKETWKHLWKTLKPVSK